MKVAVSLPLFWLVKYRILLATKPRSNLRLIPAAKDSFNFKSESLRLVPNLAVRVRASFSVRVRVR